MKEVCLINYNSYASVYGVGTYFKEYVYCLNTLGYKVNIIELGTNKKEEFAIIKDGDIRTIF